MKHKTSAYQRFPYQFEGRHFSVSRGWLELFEQVCQDVDQALGEDKRNFRWAEIKHKYGGLTMYFDMNARGQDDPLVRAVQKIIFDGSERSETICEVCGEPGTVQEQGFWLDCLCPKHRADRSAMNTGEWREVMKYERLYE